MNEVGPDKNKTHVKRQTDRRKNKIPIPFESRRSLERRGLDFSIRNQLIPRFQGNFSNKTVEERIQWLQQKLGLDLSLFKAYMHDPAIFARNVENCIGVTHFPLGVAGPLLINGKHAKGSFYVPLVTNEGSLVETYHRGAFIATLAGGINAVAYKEGVHLTPSFLFKNFHQSLQFVTWVRNNETRIKEAVESTSRYARLLRIQPILLGRTTYLNLHFKTGDASGLNMINIAADAVCRLIVAETPAERYFLRSNLSSDKKPSFFNFIAGYGKEVITEVSLKNSLIKRFLRTTSKDIFACWYQGFLGSVQAGMLGPNAQFANGLTAMFMAFGQDVAQVVNASSGIMTMEVMPNDDLRVYCKFPQLIVATVGGGTGLPFSRACLEMVDCVGDGKALKLAEIMAALATVGEISLMGAIASGEFANAAITVRQRAKIAAQASKNDILK